MRTILLSFKSDVYKRVTAGEKLYEYRRRFPSTPIKAYLYVSSPIKCIVGVMILNNKTDLENLNEQHTHDTNANEDKRERFQNNKYRMEITRFQNTNLIPLNQLRNDLKEFVVPRMYYFIDDTSLLKYLEQKLFPIGEEIVHDFLK